MAGRSRDNQRSLVRRNIAVPAPIAREGDRVLVLNYRKRPAQWEPGVLSREPSYTPGRLMRTRHWWHYTVRLDRIPSITRGGNPRRIDCSVNDDGIRKL